MNTTSLPVSRKLKEAGIELNTEWWWVANYIEKGNMVIPIEYKLERDKNCSICYPAPTLGELVRELPEGVRLGKKNGLYFCSYDTISFVHQFPEDAAGIVLENVWPMLLKVRGGKFGIYQKVSKLQYKQGIEINEYSDR